MNTIIIINRIILVASIAMLAGIVVLIASCGGDDERTLDLGTEGTYTESDYRAIVRNQFEQVDDIGDTCSVILDLTLDALMEGASSQDIEREDAGLMLEIMQSECERALR